MGRRGPAPKPTTLKLIAGTRRDRVNDSEPQPRDALPICPDDVSDDVRRVWDQTMVELTAMQTVTAADSDSLMCYVEAVVLHRKSSALIAGSAILIKGVHGNLVRNPALQIQRDAAQTIRAFAQEFGLTPSARSQLKVGGHGKEDGKARLLS